jgi:hypothetical protein
MAVVLAQRILLEMLDQAAQVVEAHEVAVAAVELEAKEIMAVQVRAVRLITTQQVEVAAVLVGLVKEPVMALMAVMVALEIHLIQLGLLLQEVV